MKKVMLGFVVVIIFVVAGGVYYVINNLDSLVKDAIEKYGSEATQTAVRVDGVSINLTDGAGEISGLTIANPEGFDIPNAFSLGKVRIGINLQSLQGEPYIINEVTVLAPQVFVEINKDNKTNLNEIKNNLMAGMPAKSTTKPEVAPVESSSNEPRLIIRRLTFADGTILARMTTLNNKEYQLKLPSIDMSNLGGSRGATPGELTSEILSRLTDRVSKLVKEKVIDAELDKLKAEARAKVDAEKARLKKKADAKIDEKKNKAKDKLKGLLRR